MTCLLASIASSEEAAIAVNGGADMIDMKDPHHGALGALPVSLIKRICGQLDPDTVTSATTGDNHQSIDSMMAAVSAVAATGVDYVKVAQQPEFSFVRVCEALKPMRDAGHQVVLVLFAEDKAVCSQFEAVIEAAHRAQLRGIMIDTADKKHGGLRQKLSDDILSDFVTRAKSRGLLTGLAGSLTLDDIEPLTALVPDYLGFRGALCDDSSRTQSLNPICMGHVKERLMAASLYQKDSHNTAAALDASV